MYTGSFLSVPFSSNLTVCNKTESHLNSAKSVWRFPSSHTRSLPSFNLRLIHLFETLYAVNVKQMLIIFSSFSAKPISLVERCYCRSTVNSLPRGYIRELRFIQTPNCPFQVVWVCVLNSWFTVCVCVALPESYVFHPGPKTSDRFPPCWTFLTINLWEVTGQIKELCMHVYTHAPLSLAFTHAVFTSGPSDTSTGSASFEYERTWTGGGNWMQVLFFFDRKAIIVGFVIGFASHLLVTRRFLLMLCLQPSGLI